jgi:tetratricopeptide (TPR) repeat protein
VLLDIDTDFLTTDSILNAENTKNIGKRGPWISPRDLAETLKEKIQAPQITTIAYSVNGGWTPMEYRHLADELAYYLSPSGFKGRFEKMREAARYFKRYNSTGQKRYYWQAAKINPAYRTADNNYGPLYLSLGKLFLAKNEFARILRADRENAACLLGLGAVALERKEFRKARRNFYSAWKSVNNNGLFKPVKNKIILALAKSEFALRNFKKAKEFFMFYKKINPLEPESCYFLGMIFEKGKEFSCAAQFYKDAIRLGFDDIGPLWRLIKISGYLKDRDAIIKSIIFRYKIFKRNFTRFKESSLKEGTKSKGSSRIEKKMLALERMINTRR